MIIVKRRKPADQWDQGEQIKKELNRVEQKYQQQKKNLKYLLIWLIIIQSWTGEGFQWLWSFASPSLQVVRLDTDNV